MNLRFPHLLEKLLEPINIESDEISIQNGPDNAIEVVGIVNNPVSLLVTMIRDGNLTPLVGDLVRWDVTERWIYPPSFFRRTEYTCRLPFPFHHRSFDLESWFIPSENLPSHLKDIHAIVFVSQSPPIDPKHMHMSTTTYITTTTKNRTVQGDIEFSGYLWIPLPNNKCHMRRIISISLHIPIPRCIFRRILKRNYRKNHVWMNGPPDAAIEELSKAMHNDDPEYKALLDYLRRQEGGRGRE